jgi:uncharacterized membrane protein
MGSSRFKSFSRLRRDGLCNLEKSPLSWPSIIGAKQGKEGSVIEELFQEIAGGVALGLEAGVVLIIASAAAKAFIRMVPLLFNDDLLVEHRHDVWMRFATAILLALEFTLAADIIRSAVAPTWDSIGRLGAIAAIRIALSFFLSRDIEAFSEARARRAESGKAGE